MSDRSRTLEARRQDRRERRERLHREERRVHLLRAALVGLLAGALGTAFQVSVQYAEAFAGLCAHLAKLAGPVGVPALLIGTVFVGGFTAHLIGRYAPESGGSGIPHVKAALLHLRIIRPLRIIVAKFFGGLAALAVGMSLGREGPTVQMGSAVGQFVGDFLNASRRGRSSLVAAGAGAGLAAAFNAPLAGFLFVMEELRREMSALTYGSALIASVCSVAVTRYLVGMRPTFLLPSPGPAPLIALPAVALLGVVCGIGGLIFNKALVGGLNLRDRLRIPRWAYGGGAGLLSGLSLLFFPYIVGGGHTLTENLLLGRFSGIDLPLLLLAIFFGKLLLTSASYGSGVPGGIFAPILVLGSVLGFLYGMGVHAVAPNLGFSTAGFATLGMAALLAGSVRAPLTGVVLIVEMTDEFGILYSLLVSAFVASLTAEALKGQPIYDELMERDLHLSGAEVHPSVEPILIEALVEPHSLMDGIRIRALRLPNGAIVTTIDREDRQIVPNGNTVLRAGDMVTVLIEGDKPELSLSVHDLAKAP